jgi:cob(I)alamin adenosyltransferase
MKIYTRTGDDGTTGLLGGGRAPKNDARVAACGVVDEFNACLGVCRAAGLPVAIDEIVARLQHEMFVLGAELASRDGPLGGMPGLAEAAVERLEREMDQLDARLPVLQAFILPGGAAGGAALHLARSVCRRMERELVSLAHSAPVTPTLLKYVNRVSDLLFVLARTANAEAGVGDVLWEKPGPPV